MLNFKNNKFIIFSIIFKVITLVIGVIGLVFNFISIGFMGSQLTILYFTIQSNILTLVGILLFLIKDAVKLFLKKDILNNNAFYLMKYCFTLGTTLTFLVFFILLSPLLGWEYLISFTNLSVHLLVPIFAIIDFFVFDKNIRFNRINPLVSLIEPLAYLVFIYSIYPLNLNFGTEKTPMKVPYFFLDFETNSWFNLNQEQIGVFYYIIILVILFILLSYLFVFLMNKRKKLKGQDMKEINFKELSKKYYEEALELLIKDCSINSVYDEKTVTQETPYGKGVSECFKLLKEQGLKDGFKVDECDNRCLELSYGEGERLICIFCHQDVVPVSGNWISDPFTPTIRDNRLYARGTSDDKGPGIAAYYAFKLLKDNGLINNFRVRLVYGGDEERGSSCLEHYFKVLKKEDPTYGFTPDAEFPLIYGEKGITNYYYKGELELKDIISIKGGVVINSVIDKCVVKVKDPSKLDEYIKNNTLEGDEKVITKDDENTFIFHGKACHGSMPEQGINAGIIALSVLGDCYNEPTLKLLANEYSDPNGRNLYCFFETKDMGKTTYNVGLINYENNYFEMGVNFRYPENVDVDSVITKIKSESPLNIEYKKGSDVLYFDPEKNQFIKELLDVYQKETGDYESKMMTIGGGTYAKEAKNTIAFGSNFYGKKDNIHEENEKIDLEDFYTSISIYAHAIYRLGTFIDENKI